MQEFTEHDLNVLISFTRKRLNQEVRRADRVKIPRKIQAFKIQHLEMLLEKLEEMKLAL